MPVIRFLILTCNHETADSVMASIINTSTDWSASGQVVYTLCVLSSCDYDTALNARSFAALGCFVTRNEKQ